MFSLVEKVLGVIVHGVIIKWLLIVHGAGITFLKRLIDWKNTPNLRSLVSLLHLLILFYILFRLFPLVLNASRLDLAQDAVRWLPNDIGGLFRSLLLSRFIGNLLLTDRNQWFFIFWWFSHSLTLRSLGLCFFNLPFFSNKALQVRFRQIKLNIEARHSREYSRLRVRRWLLSSFLWFTIFHEEKLFK